MQGQLSEEKGRERETRKDGERCERCVTTPGDISATKNTRKVAPPAPAVSPDELQGYSVVQRPLPERRGKCVYLPAAFSARVAHLESVSPGTSKLHYPVSRGAARVGYQAPPPWHHAALNTGGVGRTHTLVADGPAAGTAKRLVEFVTDSFPRTVTKAPSPLFTQRSHPPTPFILIQEVFCLSQLPGALGLVPSGLVTSYSCHTTVVPKSPCTLTWRFSSSVCEAGTPVS